MNELQKANELKEKSISVSFLEQVEARKQAKANLEKLGCWKLIEDIIREGDIIVQTDVRNIYPKKLYLKCGLTELSNELFFCQACRNKQADKAKEVYEGILR